MSLLELFCAVDDFWMSFAPTWHQTQVENGRQRQRAGQMHPSEIMTLLIYFHQSHYRTFKAYYTEYVQIHLKSVVLLPIAISRKNLPSIWISAFPWELEILSLSRTQVNKVGLRRWLPGLSSM